MFPFCHLLKKNLPEFPAVPALRSTDSDPELPSSSNLADFSPLPDMIQSQHIQDLQTEVVLLRQTMQDLSKFMCRCVEGVEQEFASRSQSETHGEDTQDRLSLDQSLEGLRLVQNVLANPSHSFNPSLFQNSQAMEQVPELTATEAFDFLSLSPLPRNTSAMSPARTPPPKPPQSPVPSGPKDSSTNPTDPSLSALSPSNGHAPSLPQPAYPSAYTFSSSPVVSSSYSPFSQLAPVITDHGISSLSSRSPSLSSPAPSWPEPSVLAAPALAHAVAHPTSHSTRGPTTVTSRSPSSMASGPNARDPLLYHPQIPAAGSYPQIKDARYHSLGSSEPLEGRLSSAKTPFAKFSTELDGGGKDPLGAL